MLFILFVDLRTAEIDNDVDRATAPWRNTPKHPRS